MDNFEYLTNDQSELGPQLLDKFTEAWSRYDPAGTRCIDHTDLPKLLRELDPPLGLGSKCPDRRVSMNLLKMNVPIARDGTVDFNATMLSIIRHRRGIKNNLVSGGGRRPSRELPNFAYSHARARTRTQARTRTSTSTQSHMNMYTCARTHAHTPTRGATHLHCDHTINGCSSHSLALVPYARPARALTSPPTHVTVTRNLSPWHTLCLAQSRGWEIENAELKATIQRFYPRADPDMLDRMLPDSNPHNYTVGLLHAVYLMQAMCV